MSPQIKDYTKKELDNMTQGKLAKLAERYLEQIADKIEEVEEIIEEIQDKTIQLVKKDDQPLFFPDLPELIKEEVEPDEIKTIKVSDEIIKGGDLTKTITFDPHYVASN